MQLIMAQIFVKPVRKDMLLKMMRQARKQFHLFPFLTGIDEQQIQCHYPEIIKT